VLSFVYGLVIVAKTLFFGIDVPGYASLLVSILFLGGIQLLGIGIIGQYLGRVYAEIKQRPIYIVRRRMNIDAGRVPPRGVVPERPLSAPVAGNLRD